MKEKSGRRSFIKNVGISSISAVILPVGFVNAPDVPEGSDDQKKHSRMKKE